MVIDHRNIKLILTSVIEANLPAGRQEIEVFASDTGFLRCIAIATEQEKGEIWSKKIIL